LNASVSFLRVLVDIILIVVVDGPKSYRTSRYLTGMRTRA